MLDPTFEEAETAVKDAVREGKMILVVGKCTANYFGRAGSKLEEGERLVVIKPDGSFMVHQNKNLPPVNYQPPGSTISTSLSEDSLMIEAKRCKSGEVLSVTFTGLSLAHSFRLSDKESISVSGTEKDLADTLKETLHFIEPGLELVKQERGSRRGPVDIVARDKDGKTVVIELKRRIASLKEVSQLQRYFKEFEKQFSAMDGHELRGVLVAPDITENAKRFLDEQGLEFRKVNLDGDQLKEIRAGQKGLHSFFECQ